MSGIMNKLGLGHKDAAHHSDDTIAHQAGKQHTATVEKAAANDAAATTTTTTTTTNNATTGHHAHDSSVHGASATGLNTTAPYGSSTATSTARTGAAYTNTTATGATAQQAGLYTERSGLSSDDAMTRSEEQLRVAKATVETGKAELNKYVETRHVEQAVPVMRERVVIEREPITAANIGDALKGPEISEAHYQTTLHEDRVAATKETVPIERIRLAKQVETSVESVGADLRKEHIDFTQTALNTNEKIDTGLHGSKIDTTSTATTGAHHTTTGAHTTGTTANTNTTRSAY